MSDERDVRAMGDGALRWRRDPSRDAAAVLELLKACAGVVDAVVTEHHALVTFDPEHPPDAPWVVETRAPPAGATSNAREHVIQARYDGPDLDEVAARASLSKEEVIAAHAESVYAVRFVGFLPGFAYLGPLPDRLVVPRRGTPRTRVEPGMIGIGGAYTGVYPFASPGGWNLIARAVDFTAFDPQRGATLRLGDRVRFDVVR
jgi:UPF0271 protein